MTWEIAVGLFTILSALCGVMKVVVKVNRTLTALDISVNQLNQSIERQSEINGKIFARLDRHDRRIYELEHDIDTPRRRAGHSVAGTPVAVWPDNIRTEGR